MTKYLIVAAHPDEEALGAGGLMHAAAKNGDEVYACVLSRWAPTRDDDLLEGIKKSHRIIGVRKNYVADFGALRFKDADHHEMVRFIENAIRDCQPDVMIIHHPGDVHIDHQVACQCSIEAAKLPMRQVEKISDIRMIMHMEVPSSTEWSLDHQNAFKPTFFYGLEYHDMEKKIMAISVYDKVIRETPHPRSKENIIALSVHRGSQCNRPYAEAFQIAYAMEGGAP